MEALTAYSSSEDEDEDEVAAGPAMPLALASGLGEEDGDEDEDEDEEEEEEAEDERPEEGPTVPLAFTADAPESEDEEDEEELEPEPELPSALPPPDFSDWSGDPEGGFVPQATAPKVSALVRGQKPKGGPHQISSGFKAAVTRHDALAQAKQDAADELEGVEAACGLACTSALTSAPHRP